MRSGLCLILSFPSRSCRSPLPADRQGCCAPPLPCTGFATLLGCLGRITFSGRCCPGVNIHLQASTWVRKTQSSCLEPEKQDPTALRVPGRTFSLPGASLWLHNFGLSWGRCYHHLCWKMSIPVAGPPTLLATSPRQDGKLLLD